VGAGISPDAKNEEGKGRRVEGVEGQLERSLISVVDFAKRSRVASEIPFFPPTI